MIDRSNPLRMLASSIPRLRCEVCGRSGGYEDIGRSMFEVQTMPLPHNEKPEQDIGRVRFVYSGFAP